MLTTIRVIPKSQRAENRINEHGEVMRLLKVAPFHGEEAVLVESLSNTWGGQKSKWLGWFTISEADVDDIEMTE